MLGWTIAHFKIFKSIWDAFKPFYIFCFWNFWNLSIRFMGLVILVCKLRKILILKKIDFLFIMTTTKNQSLLIRLILSEIQRSFKKSYRKYYYSSNVHGINYSGGKETIENRAKLVNIPTEQYNFYSHNLVIIILKIV